jgi:hypothetical protein
MIYQHATAAADTLIVNALDRQIAAAVPARPARSDGA